MSRRVARSYFKAENRTLGRFIPTAKPDRADMPAKPDLLALLAGYRGDASVVERRGAFDPHLHTLTNAPNATPCPMA